MAVNCRARIDGSQSGPLDRLDSSAMRRALDGIWFHGLGLHSRGTYPVWMNRSAGQGSGRSRPSQKESRFTPSGTSKLPPTRDGWQVKTSQPEIGLDAREELIPIYLGCRLTKVGDPEDHAMQFV